MSRNTTAIMKGIAVFILISFMFTLITYSNASLNTGLLSWAVFFVAGLVTSVTAESHKIMLSLLVVIPAAVIMYLGNWALHLLGEFTDLHGLNALQVIIFIVVPIGLALSGSGGIFGWLICKNKIT